MLGYESYPYQSCESSHTPQAYYFNRRWKRQRETPGMLRVEDIFSRDRLYRTFQRMQRESGRAPGLDGITWHDISPSEAGLICKYLSKSIIMGIYRPCKVRRILIPKPGKKDSRELNIRSIFDRVVARCLHDALSPLWETVFLRESFGFRPGLGIWDLLADLEYTTTATNTWILVIDDIRRAFDNIDIADTIYAHQNLFNSLNFQTNQLYNFNYPQNENEINRVVEITQTILQGDSPQRTIGIDQGSPYSPTALNVLLHIFHDLPFNEFQKQENKLYLPWYRYADNLVYLCQDMSEGAQMLKRAEDCLKGTKMELKGENGIVDLARGGRAELFGLNLTKHGDRLRIALADKAWGDLVEHLEEAHKDPNPEKAAKSGVTGWIQHYGPTFEKSAPPVDCILGLAARYGFRGIISPEAIRCLGSAAWYRWQDKKRSSHGIS